jgi:hypothetical protein
MANLSTYTATNLVDWINGKASMPAHAPTYLALFHGDPSSGGVEVTSTVSVGRVSISSTMESSTGGAGSSTNAADITFTTSALADSTIDFIAAYDASTVGNLIWFKSITSNNVYVGNQIKFLAGTLVVSAGGDLSAYSKDYFVNWLTGKADMPATTNRYYSLWSTDPQGGTPTEVTATIRAAGRIMFTGDMSAASSGTANDTTMIDFGSAAGSATIGWTGCSDASTLGNLIISHAITGAAQSVTTGNPVRVPVGGQVVNAA